MGDFLKKIVPEDLEQEETKVTSITALKLSDKKSKISVRAQKNFLAALAESGNVTAAARDAGVSRSTLYALRKRNDEFAKAWRESAQIGIRVLEDEACRRAMEGVETPVYYQGKEIGVAKKYSDTLLMALLKAHYPEKYADKGRSEPESGVNFSDLMAQIIERKRERENG
ncbi:MAG: hypothetical protein ACNI27_03710 [Desulfovibrio sp.]